LFLGVLWSAVESQLQHFTGEIAKIQKKLVYCGLLGWTTVYSGTASITPTTGTEHSSGASVLANCVAMHPRKPQYELSDVMQKI